MANHEEPVEKALVASSSVAVLSEDSVNSNLATLMAPAEPLPGKVREPLSGGASTPSEWRASPDTARPSPAPLPATARRQTAIRSNRINQSNVVMRRAAAELTGAVTRYRGVRTNKNNNDDNNTNNITTRAKRFQPNTLHKLRLATLCRALSLSRRGTIRSRVILLKHRQMARKRSEVRYPCRAVNLSRRGATKSRVILSKHWQIARRRSDGKSRS